MREAVFVAKEEVDRMIGSNRGRKQLYAFAAAVAIALGVIAVPQAAIGELCFNQPGVTACVAPEFRTFWQRNGGLSVLGYPLDAATDEQRAGGPLPRAYSGPPGSRAAPRNARALKFLPGGGHRRAPAKGGP